MLLKILKYTINFIYLLQILFLSIFNKKQDARIIVGVFYEDQARKVFCQAFKEGIIFPKYIWLIIGWYSENWYLKGDEDEISCSKKEMEIAVYGHISTEELFISDDVNIKFDYGIVI